MTDNLHGKTYIITGSTSGIGQAVTKYLAQQGAYLLLASRNEGKLEALKEQLEHEHPNCQIEYYPTDVTDRSQVEAMAEHQRHFWPRLDGLINCAGVMYYTYMENLNIEQWLETIDVNCKGPLHTIGATLPQLQQSNGHIINITSDAARFPFPGLAVYSGSKSFLEYLSRAMRMELVNASVKVTTIQPGNVDTNLFSHSTDRDAYYDCAPTSEQYMLQPDSIAEAIVYALKQPQNAAVNEILVQPSDQPT